MNKLQNREKDRSKTEIKESCCLCELEELILLRCLLPCLWTGSSQQSLVWLAIVTFFWRQKREWTSQPSSRTHSTASSDTKVKRKRCKVITGTVTLKTGFHLEDRPFQTEQPQASYEKNIKFIRRRRFYKIPDQSSSNLPRRSKPRKQN